MPGRPRAANRVVTLVALAAGLAGVLAGARTLEARQTSLEGRTLDPVRDLTGDAVANAVSGLFGSKPDGEVVRVTVQQDRARGVRLVVEYSGFAGNWLRAEVLRIGADGDPEVIGEIRAEPVELDGSGRATLEVALTEDVREGSAFESSRLTLVVTESAARRTGARSTFHLSKTWETGVRAENVEVRVYDEALQDLVTTRYDRPPARGARWVPDRSADVVQSEYVRFQTDARRFLSAVDGGGGALALVSAASDETTFTIEWLDTRANVGRLRTSNGWHLVALRADGSADARSVDAADPATVLQFDPDADGAIFVRAADAATASRFTDAVQSRRARVLTPVPGRAAPSAAVSRIRPPTRLPTSSALNRGGQGGGSASALTLHHSPRIGARGASREGIREALFRKRRSDAPANTLRIGETEGPAADPVFDLSIHMPGYLSGRTTDRGPSVPELLGIRTQIWGDRNGTSGVYYFLPAAYDLRWDPVDGEYGLDLQYQSSASPDDEPKVLIQATFEPHVGQAQLRAAELLVRSSARALDLPFIELRPLPIDPAATTNTVREALRNDLGADSVDVRNPVDVLGEVRVSWRMPQSRVDNLVEVLRAAQGIAAEVRVQPSSPDTGPEAIYVNLSLREPRSYPAIRWENGSFWRNELPHAVRLRSLHALVLESDERPTLLSWDLSDTQPVPSRARAAMGQALTQPVVDAAAYTWVDFSVVPDAASTEAALRSVTSGVSENLRQALVVTLLDPLSSTGAAMIKVFVRSRYLEPGSERPILRTLTFDADGGTEELALYLGRTEDEVPFEWTATLVMPDGTEHEGTRFLQGDSSLQLIVSSSALREALGRLPGGPDAR